MKLRHLRFFETVQHATHGGSPAPNDAGFEHGEPVLIVSKRDLLSIIYRVKTEFYDVWSKKPTDPKEIEQLFGLFAEILAEDNFLGRDGGDDAADLPEL